MLDPDHGSGEVAGLPAWLGVVPGKAGLDEPGVLNR